MAGPCSLVSPLFKRLEGKVALITGGASGIGACTARLFSCHGAKVVIADVKDDLAHTVISSIGPSDSTFVHCDVSDEAHVSAAVDVAVSTYGRLDVVFNNAGITDTLIAKVGNDDRAAFDRVLSVNVTGVFLGMKHAARVMVPAGRGGAIISTASVASGIGCGVSHAYTCSKHAVVGLTRSMAAELGQFGIRVNCVSPWWVATPLTAGAIGLDDGELEARVAARANLKGVMLKGEDVANSVLFLASDDGRYVSGHNIFLDGGFTVCRPPMNFNPTHTLDS